jgi:hypothetical protein
LATIEYTASPRCSACLVSKQVGAARTSPRAERKAGICKKKRRDQHRSTSLKKKRIHGNLRAVKHVRAPHRNTMNKEKQQQLPASAFGESFKFAAKTSIKAEVLGNERRLEPNSRNIPASCLQCSSKRLARGGEPQRGSHDPHERPIKERMKEKGRRG